MLIAIAVTLMLLSGMLAISSDLSKKLGIGMLFAGIMCQGGAVLSLVLFLCIQYGGLILSSI